jgi:hypothetical protein
MCALGIVGCVVGLLGSFTSLLFLEVMNSVDILLCVLTLLLHGAGLVVLICLFIGQYWAWIGIQVLWIIGIVMFLLHGFRYDVRLMLIQAPIYVILVLLLWLYLHSANVKAFCGVPLKDPIRRHHPAQSQRITLPKGGRDMSKEWASLTVSPVSPHTTHSQSGTAPERREVRGSMNKKQKVAICIAMALIVLMLVLPPWYTKYTTGAGTVVRSAGYQLLFWPPAPRARWSVHVDFPRLAVQAMIVLVAAGTFFFLFKEPKGRSRQ